MERNLTDPSLPPAEFTSRERDEDRSTRKTLSGWDRVKVLFFLVLLFMLLVAAHMQPQPPEINPLTGLEQPGTGTPGRSFEDALVVGITQQWWLLLLMSFEALRQIHYIISEHSAAWHRFWTRSVFGRFEERTASMNDWNRYRIGRALKLILWLVVIDLVVAELFDLSPMSALFELPFIFLQALPLLIQVLFYFFIIVIQFVGIFWFLSRGGTDVYFPDDIKTRFTDVWGQDSVVEKIKENMVFLEDPESIEKKGGYVPGGILLWGPPGTGKTLMAEAVAGETGKPFVFVDPGAFINMFMGVGILKVKGLFRKLRKLAVRYGGVIVFFDEADSLGNRGTVSAPQPGQVAAFSNFTAAPSCNGLGYLSPNTATQLLQYELPPTAAGPVRDGIFMGGGMMGGGGMGTLNALLTELSGLKKPRGFLNRVVRRALGMRPKPPPKYRILVMMATNMPQALDEALLRPGRIDRIYRVGYPSKEGRKRTYEGYLNQVEHELTEADIDKLAVITPYATGASIKDLVNEALINSIRDGRESINWPDIVKAKLLKSLGPPENVEYIQRERHAVAIHEACHAVAAYRVRRHLAIDIATIEKGQSYLGMVSSIPLEEQFTQWRSQFEADLIVSLASLAGERIFFDEDNSSGVSGDLRSATTITMLMEGYWGMGETIGSHAAVKAGVARPVGGAFEDGTDRNMLETELGRRVEAKLREMLERAEEIVAENRREVLAVAHALETHKTVTGDDVEAIIEGREGPLIDGRVYASDDFQETAESYHAQVVAAHRRHARVDLPLPVFGDVIPGSAVASTTDRATDPDPSTGTE